MPQLIVRNLDPRIVERLKQRAARHGCSAEAEHREILEQVLLGPERRAPLDGWLRRLLELHGARILPVDTAVAETWTLLGLPDPVPVVDGLLAATAHVHGLTLVTRKIDDVHRTGVPCLDPFRG